MDQPQPRGFGAPNPRYMHGYHPYDQPTIDAIIRFRRDRSFEPSFRALTWEQVCQILFAESKIYSTAEYDDLMSGANRSKLPHDEQFEAARAFEEEDDLLFCPHIPNAIETPVDVLSSISSLSVALTPSTSNEHILYPNPFMDKKFEGIPYLGVYAAAPSTTLPDRLARNKLKNGPFASPIAAATDSTFLLQSKVTRDYYPPLVVSSTILSSIKNNTQPSPPVINFTTISPLCNDSTPMTLPIYAVSPTSPSLKTNSVEQ